ncbi:MAG: hypothetical protein DF168_01109 [Candidatus Moanabacter tarae]|uniref:Uncharacterized protein n=1 Tax=Candidatus Moanibacter tarae TaxID=2200854 RepID=A0A2Z4AQ24_9BACT|nr:MAG: hypothetical protein DF168_01109 [Candidatus Moanabacter tarae]|tara:strand:+ start:29118 stop:30020 length:903 start_codon:yes stop_codon:yes gene_type:complete
MRNASNRILIIASLILSAMVPAISSAKSIILPVEAIEDSATMSAEEFESAHPGIDISGYIPDEEGYYVKYSHENLNYYFGPVDIYLEAVLWKDKLAAIVESVTAVRLTLQKSELEIYHFDHEMLKVVQSEMKKRRQDRNGTPVEVTTSNSAQAQMDQKGTEKGTLKQRGNLDQLGTADQANGNNKGNAIGGSGKEVIVFEQGGNTSELFGKKTEEMMRMGEGQGRQGREQGTETTKLEQQSKAVQPGRPSVQFGQRSPQSSSGSSSSSNSSSGSPSIPSAGQPSSRNLNWWEMLRSIFGR